MTLSAAPKFALQRVRTSQPQGPCAIDWSNPICKGLVSFGSTLPSGPYDAVVGKSLTKSANAAVGAMKQGLAATTTANTADVWSVPGEYIKVGQQKITIFGLGYTTDAVASGKRIIRLAGASGTLATILFGEAGMQRAAAYLRTVVIDTGASSSIVAGVVPYVSRAVAFRYAYGNFDLWENGAQTAATSYTPSTVLEKSLTLEIAGGGLYSGGSATLKGGVHCWGIWDRALTPAEIKSLSDNPWQIYEPDTLLLPAPPSTGTQTVQPNNLSYEVNWSDPVTKGLKMAVIPEDSHFNYATSRTMAVASGTYTHGVSKSGRGASTLGNSPGVVYANSETEALRNQPEGSFLIVCDVIAPTGNADTNEHVLFNLDGGNWYMGVNAHGYSNQNGLQIRFYATNYPSQTAVFTEGNYFNNKKYCVIVATYKNNGTAYFYDHDGLLGTAVCPAQNLVNGELPSAICIGRSAALGVHNITLAATFARQLTDTEARGLARNPWQIFKSKSASIAAHEVVTPRKSYMLGGTSPAPSSAAIIGIGKRASVGQRKSSIPDWSNSITKGLVFLLDPITRRNQVSGKKADTDNTTQAATHIGIGCTAVSGKPLTFNETIIKTSNGVGTGDYTLLARANPVASTSLSAMIGQDGGPGNGAAFILANADGGYAPTFGYMCIAADIGGGAGFRTALPGQVDGKFHTWVFTRAGTVFSLWRDGVLQFTGSGTVVDITSGGISFVGVGAATGYSGFNNTATFLQASAWSRALSASEIRSLSDNPWQIFLPDNQPIWGPA